MKVGGNCTKGELPSFSELAKCEEGKKFSETSCENETTVSHSIV